MPGLRVANDAGGRPVSAYIGIGSNLNDPRAQVNKALAALLCLPDSRLTACSALYLTAPWGPQDQPDYVNAAACIDTRLCPRELLGSLQDIEHGQGRVRGGTRWGARALDLDILLYGEAVIDLPGLRIPHPELDKRAFALVPLADIAPGDLSIPGRGTLARLLAACPKEGILGLGPAHFRISPDGSDSNAKWTAMR